MFMSFTLIVKSLKNSIKRIKSLQFYNIFFEKQTTSNLKRIFSQKKKQFLFLNFKRLNLQFMKTFLKANFFVKRLATSKVSYLVSSCSTYNYRLLANKIKWLFLLQQKIHQLNQLVPSKIFNKKSFFKQTNNLLMFSSLYLYKIVNLLLGLNFFLNIRTYIRLFSGKIKLLDSRIVNTNYSIKLGDVIFFNFNSNFLHIFLLTYNSRPLTKSNKQLSKQIGTNKIFLKNFEVNFLNFSVTCLSINNYTYYSGFLLNSIRFLNWRTYNWLN